jgi:hypothetical protein
VVCSAAQPDRRPRAPRPSCARRSRTTRSLVASGELVKSAQAATEWVGQGLGRAGQLGASISQYTAPDFSSKTVRAVMRPLRGVDP